MNAKSVLAFPARIEQTPESIGRFMANRFFNGRNGSETRISREDLAALLQGAAKIALKHCQEG